MKITTIIFFLMVWGLIFTSCRKNDPEYIAEKDRKALLDHIKENEWDATEYNGIFYVILREGDDNYPDLDSFIKISYTGALLDDHVFDSRNGAEMNLKNMIKGWQIGIPKFSVGSRGVLLIPSALGYGDSYQYMIPPNSPLIFFVEIIDIV